MSNLTMTLLVAGYLVLGVVYMEKFGTGTAMSILMIRASGYRLYAGIMQFLCLIFWPFSIIIAILMTKAFMKYKKIHIPKE